MTSERQIEANRQNAQFSTGPKTPEGKAESNRNATTHGLTVRKRLISGESQEEFENLRTAIHKDFSPQGALQTELVDEIVDKLWRLRRVPAFEAALIALMEDHVKSTFLLNDAVNQEFREPRTQEGKKEITFGRTIERFLTSDVSIKLNRYETMLRRELFQLLKQLQEVKNYPEVAIDL